MKKYLQIVQKYIYSSLVVMFGVLFIYGLIFATPVSGLIYALVKANGDWNGNPDNPKNQYTIFRAEHPTAQWVVDNTEIFAREMLTLAVIGLIITGVAILYRSHIRKKYYITNTIVVLGLIGFISYFLGYFVTYLSIYVTNLLPFDLEAINAFVNGKYGHPVVEGFGFYHILGYIIAFIFLFLLVNLVILYFNKVLYTIQSGEFKRLFSRKNKSVQETELVKED